MKRILLAALAACPEAAQAQNLPGRVDPVLVGDWECGETRAYITRLGSIEILDTRYRAGLFDAAGGVLTIQWEGREREDWSYTATPGALVLTPPKGTPLACEPRG